MRKGHIQGRFNLWAPWQARVKVDYKECHLGYYATKEEAVLAELEFCDRRVLTSVDDPAKV